MRTPRRVLSCAALATAWLIAAPAGAQWDRGRCQVDGLITDLEGKPVAGVKVVLRNGTTGTATELRSNAEGKWAARNIAGGEWELSFNRGGYWDQTLLRTIYPKQKRNQIHTSLRKTPFDPTLAGVERGWSFRPKKPAPAAKAAEVARAGVALQTLESLKSRLALAPDEIGLHTQLGEAYLQLGEYDSALEHLRLVHEKRPGSATALSNLAEVYLKKNDVDNALTCLDKLLALSPRHAAANYNMAEILLGADEAEEAILHYEAAIAGKPDWAAPYFKLGYASMTLGRAAQAQAAFQKYLALEPDGPEASFVRDTLQILK